MRILLRRIPAGTYFQAPGKWTPHPNQALDFKSMSRAIEFAEHASYRNIELAFVFENPRRLSTVRLDTLEGLEM